MPIPKGPHESKTWCWIGIDPGQEGGIAVCAYGRDCYAERIPGTEADLCDELRRATDHYRGSTFAMIEKIDPRPTRVFDHISGTFVNRILKSTCMIYGDYLRLRQTLTCLSIPYEEVTPQRWQKALGIPKKEKTETQTRWKNRLKQKAQQLFPEVKVTLATADALLLMEYCRRERGG